MYSIKSGDSDKNNEGQIDSTTLKIGIVVADWHEEITSKLLKACETALKSYKIPTENLSIIHVPGAFEVTFGARTLLGAKKLDGIICIGCVVKGETNHDEYINQAVATGITNLGLTSGKPVIYGVLTVLNIDQAKERAGGKYGNKGEDCAHTLIKMINIKSQFSESKTKIGY
jgi:6,7-dimethyl-8-ribityllumazine synthase